MLSLRRRLVLVQVGVTVAVMAIAAFGAYAVFARNVHRELDAALLALAETELGMLLSADAGSAATVHEAPSGPGAPSFVRLDRLVQIVGPDGRVPHDQRERRVQQHGGAHRAQRAVGLPRQHRTSDGRVGGRVAAHQVCDG